MRPLFGRLPGKRRPDDGIDDTVLEAEAAANMLDPGALEAHLKLRRSVRQYQQRPVEQEKLEKIIEAGRLTPTGSNSQNVRYIVIQHGIDALEAETLRLYIELAKQPPLPGSPDMSKYKLEPGCLFYHAPALILAVSEDTRNACLASMSMELMAESLGLGTVYVGLFTRPANQSEALRRELGIADKENIAICLTVGYPDVTYLRSAPKKPAHITWR